MLDERFMRNYKYRLRKISNKYILFGQGNCFELNETGVFVWQNINEDDTINTIIEKLANEFNATVEIVKEDVLSFVKLLLENEAIKESE